MANAAAQGPQANTVHSVLWLCGGEPPQAIARCLQHHGMSLQLRGKACTWPAARISPFGTRASSLGQASLRGRHIALLHSDAHKAHALARALRARGADVIVVGSRPHQLDDVDAFDPDAIAVEPGELFGNSWPMVRALWEHTRLRWAPVLLTPADIVEGGHVTEGDEELLGIALEALQAAAYGITAMIARDEPFEFQLNALGPLRTLRALLSTHKGLRARFVTRRVRVEVDLMNHMVVGARGYRDEGKAEMRLGMHALALLLEEEGGMVYVRPVKRPAVTNVMLSLPEALQALRNEPRIAQRAPSFAPAAQREEARDTAFVDELARSPRTSGIRPAVRPLPAEPSSSRERDVPHEASASVPATGRQGPTAPLQVSQLLGTLDRAPSGASAGPLRAARDEDRASYDHETRRVPPAMLAEVLELSRTREALVGDPAAHAFPFVPMVSTTAAPSLTPPAPRPLLTDPLAGHHGHDAWQLPPEDVLAPAFRERSRWKSRAGVALTVLSVAATALWATGALSPLLR